MKKTRSLPGVLALVFISLSTEIAHADEPPLSHARSSFERGIADLKAARFETGCAALDESYGLEPNLNTLIALGDCFERWGKPHSATLRYERFIEQVAQLEASERAYRAPQLEFARLGRARSVAATPELILVPGQFGTERLEVRLNQQPITIDGAERRLALDPGAYLLETRAPGRLPRRQELLLVAGESRRVELGVGAAVMPEAPPTLARPSPREADSAKAHSSTPWRSMGWGLGGLGVAGLTVGAIAGALVLDACPSFECRSDEAENDAATLALVADIGSGVGITGLVASTIILLVNPAPPAAGAAWHPVVALSGEAALLGVAQRW